MVKLIKFKLKKIPDKTSQGTKHETADQRVAAESVRFIRPAACHKNRQATIEDVRIYCLSLLCRTVNRNIDVLTS